MTNTQAMLVIAIPSTVVALIGIGLTTRRMLSRRVEAIKRGETEFARFERKMREEGLSRPVEPIQWFFVSFIDTESGKFAGAVFLPEEGQMQAYKAAYRFLPDETYSGKGLHKGTVVPEDKLPEPEYRERLLTLDEVRTIWPWVRP